MSATRHTPVSLRSNASVDSNKESGVSSLSSSHCTSCGLDGMRGELSCQSHFDNCSTNSCGIGRGKFSSHSCSNMHIGGIGEAGRTSTGSCPSGSYGGCAPFGHGEGQVEVSTGISCGMGVYPTTACGIIFSSIDEKEVMRNLNDRLASYIDKAQCLEAENARLESKISNFYAKQGDIGEWKDYSHNYHQIEELKKQIVHATVENNKILLKIDNNHLNLEDTAQKFQTESAFRENIEADLKGLNSVLDELVSCKCGLEAEHDSLQEELNGLKKAHEEKLIDLKKQSPDVNMEVTTCPGPDLKEILQEMRCKYEAMIDSNHKEVAQCYEPKLEDVNQEICTNSQEAEDGKQKAMDLKRQLQALEMDLQAQCKMKDTLQVTLAETECRYRSQLGEMQDQIANEEHQLAELCLEIKNQDEDYKALLNTKCRLEQEIQKYRCLLEEGQDSYV